MGIVLRLTNMRTISSFIILALAVQFSEQAPKAKYYSSGMDSGMDSGYDYSGWSEWTLALPTLDMITVVGVGVEWTLAMTTVVGVEWTLALTTLAMITVVGVGVEWTLAM